MRELPSGEPTPIPAPSPLVDLPFRLIGAVLAFRFISDWIQGEGLAIGDLLETRFVVVLVAGVTVFGWILAPFVSSRPAWVVLTHVRAHGPQQLVAGAFGFLLGVAAGAIIASTLPEFEDGLLRWLPAAVTVGFGALLAWVLGGSPAAGGLLLDGMERVLRRVSRRSISLKKAAPAVTPIERRTDQAA